MEDGRAILPLVVTTSSGVGGVSPPFSILPEKLVERTEGFGQAILDLIARPVADAREVGEMFAAPIGEIARSFDHIYQEANTSAQSMGATLAEAVRVNVEHGLLFIEDLVGAKGPSDAVNLQFTYFTKQTQLFAEQVKDFQLAWSRSFLRPAKRTGTQS
jgi:hypothetical protein